MADAESVALAAVEVARALLDEAAPLVEEVAASRDVVAAKVAEGQAARNESVAARDEVAPMVADVQANAAAAEHSADVASEAAAATAATTSAVPGDVDRFLVKDGNDNLLLEVTPDTVNHPDINTIREQAAAASEVAAIVAAQMGENAVVITDDDDNILLQVGPRRIDHPDINAIREQAAAASEVAEIVVAQMGENAVVITDGDGNILLRVSPTRIDHPDLNAIRSTVQAGGGGVATVRDPKWESIRALAEMLHIVSYGQSLSRGHNTIAPVTTTPLDYAYRFAGGVRPDDGGSDPAVVYGSLVPYLETAVVPYDPAGGLAETPLGGCLRMIAQLLRDEDGIDLVAAGQALLGSAPGAGGKSLAELASGTPYYARLVDHVTYGLTRSGGLGRGYAVSAMLWLQGERDYQLGTTQAAYLAALRQLRLDVQASAQGVTGIMRPLPVITYQTATHPRLGVSVPTIALAQLEACGDDYIALASPTYHLSYSATSDVHFDAAASAWFGAYCGLTAKRWLWDGQKPKPLKPLAPIRQGPRIIVPFDVDPARRLVLDATLGGFAHQGFGLVDGGGSPLTISSVALSGPAAVQITAAADVPAGARLRYGWAGDGHIGGGNVRDNAGDSLIFDPNGLAKPLHKWAPIFEIEVP
ncbi:sialate O-acetylesterase [Xanthobacter sp.]|uniref:sialate O-acetylesterase n=1 Tax=Xanthobacter sp. TaxID=35809 RepID=UPI002600B88A|nr:sialate O-acetylesterase [Xanthobacter sp.]